MELIFKLKNKNGQSVETTIINEADAEKVCPKHLLENGIGKIKKLLASKICSEWEIQISRTKALVIEPADNEF